MKPMHILLAVAGMAALVIGSLSLLTGSAGAHERRNVQSYTFVVGFLNEPALLNQPNSIDLRVSRTADASPVTGLEQTLKAEIKSGDQAKTMDLRPRFGTPGGYNAYFIPTKTGVYSFRFTGTLEGNQVNETFTSSPTTFSSVEEGNAFPEALPAVQNVNEAIGGLEQRVLTLEADDASGKAGTALAIGIVGVVVGVIGLAAAGLSFRRRSA